MSLGWAGGVVAIVLAVPAAAAVDHVPVDCVPYDRYTRISATADAPGIAAAQLQFRAGDGGWYSVAMDGVEGREWSAVLPRPVRPLARLDYRIVTRTADAVETATTPFSARVGDGPECGRVGQSSPDIPAPIVVQVPQGAPLVPAVPPGFSPAGVVAAEGPLRRSSGSKWASIGAGVAGLGAAAAVLLGGETVSPPGAPVDPRQFMFAGTAPPPGNVLSVSRDQFSVFVEITGGGRALGTIGWNLDFIGVGGETVCAFVGGVGSVSTAPPTTVVLSGQLRHVGACGPRFDVDRARLRVFLGGRSTTLEVPGSFHFEP